MPSTLHTGLSHLVELCCYSNGRVGKKSSGRSVSWKQMKKDAAHQAQKEKYEMALVLERKQALKAREELRAREERVQAQMAHARAQEYFRTVLVATAAVSHANWKNFQASMVGTQLTTPEAE